MRSLIIRSIKKLKLILLVPILVVISKSYILSSLFYIFLSTAFRREHLSVLFGRLKYLKVLDSKEVNKYLLRRNIHRIEKGLLMKPRKELFALKYIRETVATFSTLCSLPECEINTQEKEWAYDVLSEYFDLVRQHPIINKCRTIFENVSWKSETKKNKKVPYRRLLNKPFPVSYDQFFKLTKRRRSVRWFLQKPVPRELIDNAVKAARLSPSACNRYPFEFRIFDDPKMVQKVASLPMGTRGYRDNIPVIVVIVGKLNAFFNERDRHLIYIDSSLSAMSFILALETQGLSSCCINWPDISYSERQMIRFLNLTKDERVIMLIAVGYPDCEGLIAYSQKKSLNEIRKYN